MKKFVSLVLTALMLATMLSVFAVPASAEAQTVDNSTVTWELTENDTVLPDGSIGLTMTIGGKDVMPDFLAAVSRMDKRPWKDDVKAITTVVIDSGVTNIGGSAFYGCTSLQSVTIPSSVTSIGNNAFYGCANLQSVTIPSSVTNIGDFAFYGCANLQSVTIPSSVTNIGCSAFYGCTSLQSVTIPSGVTYIGINAFGNCTSLQSVTIPSSVTRIEDNAFSSCGKLASVTVKASTPPTLGKWAFDNTADALAIYVPCGAVEDYKGATNWSGKSDQIKEAYIVDDQPVENGTITFDKDTFPTETYTAANETVTVTVMPAEGYLLKADSLSAVAENGAAIALTQDETDPMKYTFTMPCSNVTVKAEFEVITDESEPALTATVFSKGSIWIIAAVAVLALAGVAALFIVKKKKKKPAFAGGAENTDEE